MRGPVTTLVTNVPIHNVLITLFPKERETDRGGKRVQERKREMTSEREKRGSARNREIRGKMVMMMIVLKTLSLMTLSRAVIRPQTCSH